MTALTVGFPRRGGRAVDSELGALDAHLWSSGRKVYYLTDSRVLRRLLREPEVARAQAAGGDDDLQGASF